MISDSRNPYRYYLPVEETIPPLPTHNVVAMILSILVLCIGLLACIIVCPAELFLLLGGLELGGILAALASSNPWTQYMAPKLLWGSIICTAMGLLKLRCRRQEDLEGSFCSFLDVELGDSWDDAYESAVARVRLQKDGNLICTTQFQ